jgi:serine/threonine protein kinase
MTRWLGDDTVTHLRDVAEWPDLGDRYEITGRLGRGGMGVVFQAHDRTLTRDVAVKVFDSVEGDRTRAEEPRVLAQLEHPGIVPVHDAGVTEDGRAFYVMKLVRGKPLQRAQSTGEGVDLFLKICDAVSFAHANGIIHRDLKPDNVMVGPFGEVLVMDWGVARAMDRAGRPGVVVGTPGFMAPEQAAGDDVAADARVDVFALGALLHAMLPEPMPRRLAAIARRAAAERPGDRYANVAALTEDVVRFRDGEAVDAYQENALERVGRFYDRYRVPIVLVLVYMVVRVALLVWGRT